MRQAVKEYKESIRPKDDCYIILLSKPLPGSGPVYNAKIALMLVAQSYKTHEPSVHTTYRHKVCRQMNGLLLHIICRLGGLLRVVWMNLIARVWGQ